MTDSGIGVVQAGLLAWVAGDMTALDAVLDPQVELRSFESDEWGCTGRDRVLTVLGRRRAKGQIRGLIRVDQVDERSFVLSPAADGADSAAGTAGTAALEDSEEALPATRITVIEGK